MRERERERERERGPFNVLSSWLGKSRQSPQDWVQCHKRTSPRGKPGAFPRRYRYGCQVGKAIDTCCRVLVSRVQHPAWERRLVKGLSFLWWPEQDQQGSHKHWVPSRSKSSKPSDGWAGRTLRKQPGLLWYMKGGLKVHLVLWKLESPKRDESGDSSKN